MGVGAGLDHVILFDLLVEERVEAVLARAEGVDLTHQHEYRSQAFSADMERVRVSRSDSLWGWPYRGAKP